MTDKKSDNAGKAAEALSIDDIRAAMRALEDNGVPDKQYKYYSVPNEADWLINVAGVSPDNVVVLQKLPVNV